MGKIDVLLIANSATICL